MEPRCDPPSLPSRWEVAKARLGFSAGSTDPCRAAGLLAGKSWRKQHGDAQRLGVGGGLGQGGEQDTLQ